MEECVIEPAHFKYAALLAKLPEKVDVHSSTFPQLIRSLVAQYVPENMIDAAVEEIVAEVRRQSGGGPKNRNPGVTGLSSCDMFTIIATILSGLIAGAVLFQPVRGGYRKNKKMRSTKKKQNRKQRKQSRRQ